MGQCPRFYSRLGTYGAHEALVQTTWRIHAVHSTLTAPGGPQDCLDLRGVFQRANYHIRTYAHIMKPWMAFAHTARAPTRAHRCVKLVPVESQLTPYQSQTDALEFQPALSNHPGPPVLSYSSRSAARSPESGVPGTAALATNQNPTSRGFVKHGTLLVEMRDPRHARDAVRNAAPTTSARVTRMARNRAMEIARATKTGARVVGICGITSGQATHCDEKNT